jgi:short-subunit dehydrogenase
VDSICALRRELKLFGIDLVIIEPGAVNTAMYDKGETEDLSEFKTTPLLGSDRELSEIYCDGGTQRVAP